MRNNLNLCKLLVRDSSGTCEITWYNQPYLRNVFKTNVEYKFYGKVSKKFGGRADMQSPVYELAENSNNTGKIIPIYPLTYNLTQNNLRKIIENGLLEVNGKLEETLPQYLLAKYNLEDIENVSKVIGVGAIIFNDLKNYRANDIEFNLEDTLKFEGNTGPYLQYTYARISSIMRKITEVKYDLNDISVEEFLKINEQIVNKKIMKRLLRYLFLNV
nr:hypothetical protein [uncultured Methanobrevibacter sp.]